MEPEYSMLKDAIEKELLPCCQRYTLGMLPYFPLASGFLTGKYKRGRQAAAGTRFSVQTQRRDHSHAGEFHCAGTTGVLFQRVLTSACGTG
ncbi:MAG TPA: aldo/keto reductase [Candidatus Tectomicrobia bacterium]